MSGAPHAFVLAGGRGTRFWPLSRRERPKQLLDFTGQGSLLALTCERLEPLVPPENQWVITSADLVDAVREVVPEIPPAQVLAEPTGRNTAPAVALAATLLLERGEDVPFAVLPSDHLITPATQFRERLGEAFDMARHGEHLITFGVRPDRPETGYGYIETGAAVEGAAEALRVAAFREKPDLQTAESYLASGRHLWNSGMFVWRASVVAAGLQEHAPGVVGPLRELAGTARPGTEAFGPAFQKAYESVPSISIDYALMEKADDVVVLPVTFRWNDVGHWAAMRDLWPHDSEGNAFRGRVVAVDAASNVVHGEDRLTALIGVEDLVVVSTDRVTMVCPVDRSQDVKRLLERLEVEGLDSYL
ncbi:MAG TPA: sugar phosphate nucleotidyltransferase [Candidatus Krumholzibacteria bacterium]|nr:sugar phosphate nucleotidyltransferase [Candidatus Krumholzibacteria bacterium]